MTPWEEHSLTAGGPLTQANSWALSSVSSGRTQVEGHFQTERAVLCKVVKGRETPRRSSRLKGRLWAHRVWRMLLDWIPDQMGKGAVLVNPNGL